jgi:hypothetical protein
MLAHIVGLPVEETALSLAPIAAAAGGLARLRLQRRRSDGRRERVQRPWTWVRR